MLLDNDEKYILEVDDLCYCYDHNKEALKNVKLKIKKGEKIAVMGSNGAGKSTFFLNLNGVLKKSCGHIYLKGKEITSKHINELRKNVGIVFQDADNQIIASTVLAEVSFGPMNLNLVQEEVRERVDQALSYMNISEFKLRPPHYLSGGEKKRVTIADIIAMKSEIIIFDEPTSSLDPLNAQMLEEVLSKLTDEGKTIIISTHDVDFAYRWAQRIVVFSHGRIIADDKPINIFKNNKVIEEANLKKPMLLEVYESLLDKNLVKEKNIYPRNINEFKEMI